VFLPKGTELAVVEHCDPEVAKAPVTFSLYQGSPLPR